MTNTPMLKGAIVEAGYTQAKLAEKLNMSVNTLSSKISGKTKFTVDEATMICEILNIVDDKRKVHIFFSLNISKLRYTIQQKN